MTNELLDTIFEKDMLEGYLSRNSRTRLANMLIWDVRIKRGDLSTNTTIADFFSFYQEEIETSYRNRAFTSKGIGDKILAGMDRLLRDIGLVEIPYFLSHLPIVGEDAEVEPIQLGRLRVGSWDRDDRVYVFSGAVERVGEEPKNLLYWDTEEKERTLEYRHIVGNMQRISFDDIVEYKGLNGASDALDVQRAQKTLKKNH